MGDFFDDRKSGKVCDVEQLLDATYLEYVRDLAVNGALVSVGTTRDGGALALTVTYDGQWRREYFTDQEELAQFLREAADAVTALGGRPTAPTSQRSRARRPRAT